MSKGAYCFIFSFILFISLIVGVIYYNFFLKENLISCFENGSLLCHSFVNTEYRYLEYEQVDKKFYSSIKPGYYSAKLWIIKNNYFPTEQEIQAVKQKNPQLVKVLLEKQAFIKHNVQESTIGILFNNNSLEYANGELSNDGIGRFNPNNGHTYYIEINDERFPSYYNTKLNNFDIFIIWLTLLPKLFGKLFLPGFLIAFVLLPLLILISNLIVNEVKKTHPRLAKSLPFVFLILAVLVLLLKANENTKPPSVHSSSASGVDIDKLINE